MCIFSIFFQKTEDCPKKRTPFRSVFFFNPLLSNRLVCFYLTFFLYPFFFMLEKIDCKTMKKQSNADSTIRTHQLDNVPCVVIRLEIVPLINTPNTVPNGVPTPPLSSVPPMTAEEMASISIPFACSTKPEQLFKQNRNPPIPAKSPSSTYAFNFVLRTFSPIIRALCALPPTAKPLVESYGAQGYVVQNPPARPLTTMEMDDVYALPYQRTWHPSYDKLGGIPAFDEIKFSLTSNRGCFGGCNFCALTFHQGRTVQVRSHASILAEAKACTQEKDFKGYIHDVGGPTADFRHPSCKKQLENGVCSKRQCLFPKPCPNLEADHEDYLELLHKLRDVPGVKKVFIRSGIRFDYVLADKNPAFLRELVAHHVSGQLRVAPEHFSDAVLCCMGKPAHHVYERFVKKFKEETEAIGKKQYAVPYFMSSHPGCTMKDAVALAEYVRDMGFMPEQVQDFYPTPSTVSTCMYYTGMHPLTGEAVYVPRNPHEKAIQRALIQYRNPANEALVREGLTLAGREDLIGFDRKCLIRPKKGEAVKTASRQKEERKQKKKTIRNVHKKKNRK